MSEPIVSDNTERHRYELLIDGEVVGISQYRDRDGARDVFHTEINDGFAGRGLGTVLVEGALADVRATGSVLIPTCPMVAGYLAKHPDQNDLLHER